MRQPAAARFHGQVAVFKNLFEVPERIKTGHRPRWRTSPGRHAFIAPPLHKEARIGARHQPALRHQPVVGLYHGEHAHAMRSGKSADGRELAAGFEHLPNNQAPQPINDLADQRCLQVRAESEHQEGKKGGELCTGLAHTKSGIACPGF